MKYFFSIFCLTTIIFSAIAQPQVLATYTYPKHENSEIRAGFPLSENEYYWAGVSNLGKEKSDALLLQTDGEGKEIAFETFARGQQEELRAMVKQPDGGLAFVGTTKFYNEEEARTEGSIWFVRLNKDKQVIINKKWEVFETLDEGVFLANAPDGGFLIVGNIRSRGQGKSDIWVVKIDKDAKLVWEKIFGGKEDDIATCVAAVKNNYVLTACVTSPEKKKKYRTMMLTQDGFVLWDNVATETNETQANYVLALKNGDCLVLGTEDVGQGNEDAMVLKFNAKGKLLWKQKFGGTRKDIFYTAIEYKGGFLLGGTTFSNRNDWGWGDMWLMKINAKGEKDWSNTFGEENLQEAIKAICINKKQEMLLAGEQFKDAKRKNMIILKVK